ncbi:hypothetical protein IJI55_02470 [Candidatus Saccharibacteria bacterium]|nr:hypothetical protein [Candidatus Saccharibacteria bacterium]
MQRLFIVYNPRSTRAELIRKEVILPAKELKGFLVGKFEVEQISVVKNAGRLAKLLDDGDIVMTAGGDGTTEVGVNAIMECGKDVRLMVLPYGNFNDVARMFGMMEFKNIFDTKVVEAYPLECLVNGKHFQYAFGYFTVGMMADAARMLNRGKKRAHLRKNKNNTMFALTSAVKWYLKNRKRKFLLAVKYNGKEMGDMTEYFAVNSGTVARIMKLSPSFMRKKEFKSGIFDLKNFWKMTWFGMRSVLCGLKLSESVGDKLEFAEPVKVVVQSEGECVEIAEVETLEFKKCGRPIKVFKI